jgi:hypothetical protein
LAPPGAEVLLEQLLDLLALEVADRSISRHVVGPGTSASEKLLMRSAGAFFEDLGQADRQAARRSASP